MWTQLELEILATDDIDVGGEFVSNLVPNAIILLILVLQHKDGEMGNFLVL